MVKRELQILQKISKSAATFEFLAHELMTSETQTKYDTTVNQIILSKGNHEMCRS